MIGVIVFADRLTKLVGASLWFVLDHWTIYRRQLGRIWRRSEGGMALYGGMVLAILVSPGVLTALGVGFAGFWDGATFTILVGMIFTRVGCLVNVCCSERPTEGRVGLWLPDPMGLDRLREPSANRTVSNRLALAAFVASSAAVVRPAGW